MSAFDQARRKNQESKMNVIDITISSHLHNISILALLRTENLQEVKNKKKFFYQLHKKKKCELCGSNTGPPDLL